jgi:hypothetical protein
VRFFLLLAALCSPALDAQWFRYPTPGIPRTADGKPNLTAPAPKSRDGKPDLSGVWLASSKTLPCPALIRDDSGECLEKTALPIEAANIAQGLGSELPYTPWARDLVKERAATAGKEDPHVRCLPIGYPRAYTLPHYQKFIHTAGLLVILDEFNASYRQIFTDNRPMPKDPQPSWNGYSTAKWEGNTLVVTTSGFRDDLWLDMRGDPMTDRATLTERFRRPNFGTLEVDFTVDDPKAYTKPWTVKMNLSLMVDEDLVDEICAEGEKSLSHIPGK